MKKVGGGLKMLMGEYRKMAGEQALGGASLSPVMIRGARCLQLFNQKGHSYFFNSVVALYAVLNGYMDDVKLNYSKYYEYLLVAKDLSIMYGQTTNKYFYMYNKKMNYFVRLLGLDHPVLSDEVKNHLEVHTKLFLDKFQSRMELLTSDAELIHIKTLLYSCKRCC
eukprot:NODE_529_length_831_cov_368.024297_g468_i0.p1 GENE.NODE_529_length_831_cov_368.024297_g468_i0~~NODE_529_length_831_cov_368.024297_g468_i0.p1  ORF type:complete len:166 (+),score=44.51 NODE_529_length_831_cov_368.024297_g468_i0:223-720(+)